MIDLIMDNLLIVNVLIIVIAIAILGYIMTRPRSDLVRRLKAGEKVIKIDLSKHPDDDD
ncbi:MAG: hypothetical protein JW944_07285 [Deltaproteobacteria bacterium]|nr:hypothetical protein [Deltaproteobacteria bacterium]